jgi:hypothetical protein
MISATALADYLSGTLGAPTEILAMRALTSGISMDDPKGFGYGVPFEVECVVRGVRRSFVVSRTRPTQGFGHDYPADRAWQALYGHAAYNSFPRHVRSLDVGFVRESGPLVSASDAVEFFQLVEKGEGTLYWLDLQRLLTGSVEPRDMERAKALARFLAAVHAEKREEPTLYHRRIRELVAHGECLMGILDSYPHPYPLLPPQACQELEQDAISWRWRLRGLVHRLSRVHGDFHPWNILFGEGTDFSVLDRSRGEWGEPADDVAALAVNYLFFGLRRGSDDDDTVSEPFDTLFQTFMETYLHDSGDQEILEVLPPFFTFRALVIAHPRWYPTLSPGVRTALIGFARWMMAARRLEPGDIWTRWEALR